jgi:hypothetical protein
MSVSPSGSSPTSSDTSAVASSTIGVAATFVVQGRRARRRTYR